MGSFMDSLAGMFGNSNDGSNFDVMSLSAEDMIQTPPGLKEYLTAKTSHQFDDGQMITSYRRGEDTVIVLNNATADMPPWLFGNQLSARESVVSGGAIFLVIPTDRFDHSVMPAIQSHTQQGPGALGGLGSIPSPGSVS